jgi:hypothetical protein
VISGAVIGRDAELDFVRAFLDDVGGGPAGLVLSGEAGIGKTILWQAGVEQARGRFAHVLTCRGTEAEAALSFAGCRSCSARCWRKRSIRFYRRGAER